MQAKQATGIDTRRMVPVYGAIAILLCQLFAPWISLPVLKYGRVDTAYSVIRLAQAWEEVQSLAASGSVLRMPPFTAEEIAAIQNAISAVWGMALLVGALMLLCCALVLWKKERALPIVRAAFGSAVLYGVLSIGLIMAGNVLLNLKLGRANSFANLSIHSYLQMTSWMYGQLILSVGILWKAKPLLVIREEQPRREKTGSVSPRRGIGRRTKLSFLLLVLAIPLVIFFGISFLNDRSHIFIGLCIVCLSMLPFAMVFEDRHPQARELLLIAVLSAIAVAGRVAFFAVPQVKPIAAVIIIAGVSLGPEAGFLVGTMSGFVSNFFFGQGPWTPWQMFAYGIIGFLAGILFARRKSGHHHRFWVCLYGGLSVFLIYGLLMDLSSVVNMMGQFSWQALLAKLISGIPFNLLFSGSTAVFLILLLKPMERKLSRIKKKYGLLET